MPDAHAAAAPPRPDARVASALLLVANVLFFWPVLFHGRVFSSHGAALAVSPWRSAQARDDPRARFLADPASGSEPFLRDLPAKALWDPEAGGGSPGAINVVRGFLSPFAWIPALLLPESAIETGVLFLKLNAGFLFLFLFLRGRGLPETAASCGAAAWGWSGAQSAWWLWMQSSVTVAFPLLLLAIDRSRAERRFDRAVAPAAAAFLLFLSGGYPFMLAYGAAAALAWAGASAWKRPAKENGRAALRLAAAAVVASAVLYPAFRLSARVLRASGQIEARSGFAREIRLPARHALLYGFPLAPGDPAAGDYRPLTESRFETFGETAVGVGPAALALALFGVAGKRHRRLSAFGILLAAAAAAALYVPPARALGESLPFLSAGLLERVKVLAVLGIAIAAAVGAEALERVLAAAAPARRAGSAALPFIVGVPLVLVAARVYPAVPPGDAVFAPTPGIAALERAAKGSRFLATGWTLYPELAEPFGLEDVRGRLFFERDYRRLLSAADARIYGRTGTLLIADPATLDPASPVLDFLGVTAIAAAPGEEGAAGVLPVIYRGADLAVFRRPAAFPRFFLVHRWAPGGVAEAARASREELRSAAFVDPRDLGRLPSGGGDAKAVAPSGGGLAVELAGVAAFRLRVRAASPALLVSSQKLFPPYWSASLDGARVAPVRVDGLFFGLPIPAGEHVVACRFRIPRAETAVSGAGAAALLALAAACRRRAA